jgi:hypothetical protein
MSSEHDFDFFIGAWRVSHRYLKQRLANCTEWAEFAGVTETRKILGGFGNIDDNTLNKSAGAYRAVTLRAFDPETRQWSIWWLDGRTPRCLDTPMRGEFENGVGLFFADDALDGRPIRVRFTWTQDDGDGPRWEQAFSADGGATWETNWIMRFTRTEAREADLA